MSTVNSPIPGARATTPASTGSTEPNVGTSSRPAKLFSARWWSGNQGWSGLAQWPNPALVVWLLTAAIGWTGIVTNETDDSIISGLGHGALVVWGLDELVRGTSPIRRVLGAVVLTVQLARLFS